VLENIPTFVTEFGSRDFLVRDEKGIRCETGAVPAAVSLNRKIFRNLATVGANRWEGPENKVSQKTCQINKFIIAFGIKAVR
jgi:hypothetical protein